MPSSSTPFDTIQEFCKNNPSIDNPLIEKILLYIFYNEFHEMLKIEKDKGTNIDESFKETIKSSLLSEINLNKNIEIASSQINTEINKKTKWIERFHKVKNGFAIIGLNILSSAVFTLILIGLFILMENEIKPKMQNYLSQDNEHNIEQIEEDK